MILACFFWFTLILIFTYRSEPNSDLFGPTKFIVLKYAIFNLPFILYIHFNPQRFPQEILNVCNVDLEEAFVKYTLVQTFSILALVVGIRYGNRKLHLTKSKAVIGHKHARIIALAFFFIGVAAFGVFLNSVGGIFFLLNNLSSRTELQSGQFVLNFLPFLTLAVLLMLYSLKAEGNFLNKVLFLLMLIVSILIYSSLGGRKNSLYLIITTVVGYHYVIKRIVLKQVKKTRILAYGFLIVFYIFFIPLLRSKDGFETLSNKETDLIEVFQIEDLVYSISYTYIDIFAANYFTVETAWYLSSAFDIPINIFSNTNDRASLPPIDDGVYFRSIVEYNRNFVPPVARGEMYASSWPIENFGFGYANFLTLGVIIVFFLQGLVFRFAYDLLKKENFNPVFIYLYVYILFNFNFSNLRLTQLLLMLPIFLGSILVLKTFKKKYG